jgi:hypothetical protein
MLSSSGTVVNFARGGTADLNPLGFTIVPFVDVNDLTIVGITPSPKIK